MTFNKAKAILFLLLTTSLLASDVLAQSTINLGNQEVPVTTAVPFLRIIPDARAGGMADIGLATSPDNYSHFHNPAKLAFVGLEKKGSKSSTGSRLGFGLSYIPWLRTLVNDIYMANLTGYYRINKMQTIGMSFRYFSLGNITFTNITGETTGEFRPNEFSMDLSYARVLAKGFSTAISMRFIYSNLASGQNVGGVNIQPGIAASADIAFYYTKDFKIKSNYNTTLAFGLNLSNLGSKITYTESATRDFIPMNMGFGARYTFNIDDYNQVSIMADMNKLLVPTPIGPAELYNTPNNVASGIKDEYDEDGNGIPDFREKSVPAGLFGSFSDAPGGAGEELREITWAVGAEYWYDQLFALRVGYFHENENKGNRKFITAGIGLRYSMFGIDFSYLIPTTAQRNPLDNTLRFTLVFNFDNLGGDEEAAVEQETGL